MPSCSTALAVAWGWKYMSWKAVVPDDSISRPASAAPARTCSAVRWRSSGQIFSSSHCRRGTSSVYPRNSTMAAWVWVFENPGITARPRPSITWSTAAAAALAPASGPTAAMRPSSISRSPVSSCRASSRRAPRISRVRGWRRR